MDTLGLGATILGATIVAYLIGRNIITNERSPKKFTLSSYRRSLSIEEINRLVAQDLWFETKNPWCDVGGTNFEHEIMGLCPCL
jgi:hypothetical protein